MFFFYVFERSGARFAHARNTETFTTHTHSRGATVLVTALRPRYSGSPRPAVCSLQVALASHLKAFSFLSRRRFLAERVSAAGVRCCTYCTGDCSLPPGVASRASVQCALVGVTSTVVGSTAGLVRGRPPRRCSAANERCCDGDGG